MDKIWFRNPSMSEVIGRCGGDGIKNDWPHRTDKSRMLKIKKIKKLSSVVEDIEGKDSAQEP